MKKKSLMLLAILLLSVGFASVSTTLHMNGNVKIATNDADFDVQFTKATLDGIDVSSTAISEDKKFITFQTKDLSTVGDISKLDFEVTNNSEMYDAEVSIECTANGANESYYEMKKEVATPIEGKNIGTGKVEVKLVTAAESFSENFICSLKAKAKERTEKAKGKYIPKYFAFGNPTTASTQDYTTLKYTGVSKKARIFGGLDAVGEQKSVCTLATGSLECFKDGVSNAAEEQAHLREVFGDSCSSDGSNVTCNADIFTCEVNSNGYVYCYDDTGSCSSDGSDVTCYSVFGPSN